MHIASTLLLKFFDPLVLVAHNGFAFDYPFLMTEIKRHHNLEESFGTAELWFADTLYDVRRVNRYNII